MANIRLCAELQAEIFNNVKSFYKHKYQQTRIVGLLNIFIEIQNESYHL